MREVSLTPGKATTHLYTCTDTYVPWNIVSTDTFLCPYYEPTCATWYASRDNFSRVPSLCVAAAAELVRNEFHL